jgi:hypothetical protein
MKSEYGERSGFVQPGWTTDWAALDFLGHPEDAAVPRHGHQAESKAKILVRQGDLCNPVARGSEDEIG